MANRGNLSHFCVDFKKAFDSVLDFFRVLALNVAAKKLCSPCRYKKGQRFIVFFNDCHGKNLFSKSSLLCMCDEFLSMTLNFNIRLFLSIRHLDKRFWGPDKEVL